MQHVSGETAAPQPLLQHVPRLQVLASAW